MRYDYSLDVGQSIKSEEELDEQQEKEKQQDAQENAPSSGEELTAKRVEEEIRQEAEKEAAEKAAEASEEKIDETPQPVPEAQSEKDVKEDISVKEISFEKAELIEEHKKAQKTIEKYEEESGEEQEKPADELEEDVNEIIEDSFNEPKEYMNKNHNNNVKEYVPEQRGYLIPIALVLMLLGAIVFGFVYFMYPGETAPAAAAGIPGQEINLAPVPEEEPETAEIIPETEEELPVVPEKNKALPVNKSSAVVKIIKEPEREKLPRSGEQVLNDLLLKGLTD